MIFYIFHRHRVRLVDCVDLIWNFYSWWEGFGSSSLAILHLDCNCSFISTSACGLSTAICSWGCPGGLRSAPVRARCGGGAAAWVTGVLAAPGTQRSWWLGQQEIQCSRRIWKPVLANTAQHFCLENPPPWQRSLKGQSTRSQRVRHDWRNPVHIEARLFLPMATLPQWELSMKMAQLLGLWGPWLHQVCKDMDCLLHRSYGLIRVFFWTSCHWRSEGFFGQSFSIALPIL